MRTHVLAHTAIWRVGTTSSIENIIVTGRGHVTCVCALTVFTCFPFMFISTLTVTVNYDENGIIFLQLIITTLWAIKCLRPYTKVPNDSIHCYMPSALAVYSLFLVGKKLLIYFSRVLFL